MEGVLREAFTRRFWQIQDVKYPFRGSGVHGFRCSGLTENLNCPTSKVDERKVTLNGKL